LLIRGIRGGAFTGTPAQCRPIDPAGGDQSLHLEFDAHSGCDAHMDMF